MNNQPYQHPAWTQQPAPSAGGPPPPQPPKKRSPGLIALAAVGVICFWVIVAAALDDDTDKQPSSTPRAESSATAVAADDKAKPPPATEAAEETPGLSKRELTRLSVELVWDGYDEEQRDTLCVGVGVYGEEWFADQMQSDSLDNDYAAELVADKCESR